MRCGCRSSIEGRMLRDRSLKEADSEVFEAIGREIAREQDGLVMIASENYASRAVMEAQGSVMTNKYAEGYPGARYYGGCEYVDTVEHLAIERARTLFGAEYANVQPHSGSQANMGIYISFLEPGDTILGMGLAQGGHLTHGSAVSFSGKLYNAISYGVHPESHRIDYDQVRDLTRRHKPRLIIAGASAYPRYIDFDLFAEIAHENDAYLMADMAHIAGLVAAGLHPTPIGRADFVTTTTHKTLRGPRGGLILSDARYGEKLDKGIFPGIQGGPLMHVIAAKAVALGEALGAEFTAYQKQVIQNAKALGEALTGFGFDLVSGGTDNHLLLLNLSNRSLTGKDAEAALVRAGIVANKNAIPYDRRGPKITSGLRLGTPALTTRGMGAEEMRLIAGWIRNVLEHPESEMTLAAVGREVRELCRRFPVYAHLEGGVA